MISCAWSLSYYWWVEFLSILKWSPSTKKAFPFLQEMSLKLPRLYHCLSSTIFFGISAALGGKQRENERETKGEGKLGHYRQGHTLKASATKTGVKHMIRSICQPDIWWNHKVRACQTWWMFLNMASKWPCWKAESGFEWRRQHYCTKELSDVLSRFLSAFIQQMCLNQWI